MVVLPALVPGTHASNTPNRGDGTADGEDKPGHDQLKRRPSSDNTTSIPEAHEPPPVLQRSLALHSAHAAEADARRQIAALMKTSVPAYQTFRGLRRRRELREAA